MNIRRIPDRARVGPVIVERGVNQRDGGVAPRRAALPLYAAAELPVQRRKGPRGEVEKLVGEEGFKS